MMLALKHWIASLEGGEHCTFTVAVPAMLLFSSLLAAGPAEASLIINPLYDSSITSLSNASTVIGAFNTVASDFAKSFTSNVTINVGVSWGSVGGYALPSTAVGASTESLYGYFGYSQVKSYLTFGWLRGPCWPYSGADPTTFLKEPTECLL